MRRRKLLLNCPRAGCFSGTNTLDPSRARTAENLATLIVNLSGDYSHILAPNTTGGKNVMPRVAALLDVAQISDITAVESADTFQRPIYAGNAIATVQSLDSVKVITGTSSMPRGFMTGWEAPRFCGMRRRHPDK